MAAPGQSSDDKRPLIIVKRYRRSEGGHHGGAWKIAYADFVTAMMAFFLVMWLVTSVSKQQRAAIFDYFKNPSMEPGKSVKPAPGQMGPGGASTSVISLGGGLDAPRTSIAGMPTQLGAGPQSAAPNPPGTATGPRSAATDDTLGRAGQPIAPQALESKRLEALLKELREAISKSQALKPFKDQLLLDIMAEGLRVQIVDAQNRPMFDVGGARLKSYTVSILKTLAPYLASVPNRISITGHTDATPYVGAGDYSNWELSADRANAARRVLVASGLPADKIGRVIGLADSAPFDKVNPLSPVNRRISIIVMTHEVDKTLQDLAQAPPPR
ncbi:MAG TPA: flagellar motor protein MotB [Steroidobacteraceae bacterium]|nr:flagellar motor protein MotB [Steroidobacteraceae bacterium]